MMKRQYRTLALVLALWLPLGAALPATACVGKTLVVGYTGSSQQEVLAQVIAILITERTGTTVKTVKYDSPPAMHESLRKADLDIAVEYTGVAQVEVLKGPAVADPAALYQAVKDGYNQELNLVWLSPFGFDEPRLAPAGTVAQAAPVVRKDTLKKFPALSRLINKLGGAVDAGRMRELEAQTGRKGARDAARDFLKAGKFI
jgi:osmoprotectant transport system substrate-binding protein